MGKAASISIKILADQGNDTLCLEISCEVFILVVRRKVNVLNYRTVLKCLSCFKIVFLALFDGDDLASKSPSSFLKVTFTE